MNVRRTIVPAVVAAALVAGAWSGWAWWHDWRWIVSTDNAYVEADAAVIAPQIDGYVGRVLVADNQRVRAGDLLVEIDAAAYAARSAAAHAAADAAGAQIVTIDRQLALQDALITRAQAGIEAAQADVELAGRNFERAERLAEGSWQSREQHDAARNAYDRARAALDQARADLASARGQKEVLLASRRQAEAAVGQALAQARVADDDLAHARITAPVDGVVGNKAVEVGQYVKAGMQLLSVVPLPLVHVVANFKETQLQGLKPGQPVTITVDAYPDVPITGRIDSFAPGSGAVFSLLPPENATGNFTKIVQRVPIKVAVPADNPLAGYLRPGLSVEVAVDTRSPGDPASVVAGAFGAVPGDQQQALDEGTDAAALR